MADMNDPDSFPITNAAHRRSLNMRLSRWIGFACLIGGLIALIEVEPLMAIGCAAVGLSWLVAARISI